MIVKNARIKEVRITLEINRFLGKLIKMASIGTKKISRYAKFVPNRNEKTKTPELSSNNLAFQPKEDRLE